MPSSTSTNAPNSVRLRTLPVIVVPTGYLLRELVPRVGLDLLQAERNAPRARIDAEHHALRPVARLRIFDGCLTRLLHDISETWIRPSTPGSSSMNAP